MMRSRLRSTLFIACSVLVTAACSSATRAGFDDQTANDTTPAPTTTTTPPPPPTQVTGGPITPTTDASVPDAPDTCTRTAPSNKCGLVPQCGCTSAETCDVTDTAGNVDCVTAGTAPMGKPCTTTAGCGVGLTCVFGTCHSFCATAGSACTAPNTGNCIDVKMTGGASVPNLDVCMVKCDLRDPNACGGTTAAGTAACLVDSTGNTDCQTASGPHKVNETCTPTDDCGPGLVCVGTGGTTSTCKKWCQVGSADCGAGKTCGGFQTKLMVGGVELGACP